MSDAYQTRRDIDRVIRLANDLEYLFEKNGVKTLGEFMSKYYDASDVDVQNHKINSDINDVSDAIGDVSDALDDVDAKVGTVDVTTDGSLQTQIDNIAYYDITPQVYKSNLVGYVYSTTFRLWLDQELIFIVEGFTRTGTPITSPTLTATLYTPSGQETLTANKNTWTDSYSFRYTPTETGVYMLQIGDSTCTCFASETHRINNIINSLSWNEHISDSNYDVYYNDYFVALSVHISDSSASSSWERFGAEILDTNLMPPYAHVFYENNGVIQFRVTDTLTNDAYKYLWRRTMNGSSLSNVNVYAHTVWKRR